MVRWMVMVGVFVVCFITMSQAVLGTNYYSAGNTDAKTLASWWTNTNGTGSNPANFTTAGNFFIIQNGHTMSTSGAWGVSGAGSTIQINTGGTLVATFDVSATVITVASGATYQHNFNGGAIPTATWDAGSVCSVTGITSTSISGKAQSFGNFSWNCPSQTVGVGLNTSAFTIKSGCTFTLTATGSGSVSVLNDPFSTGGITQTWLGNLVIDGGIFNILRASSSNNYNASLTVNNLTINGGALNINYYTTNDGRYPDGTISIAGDFVMSGGTLDMMPPTATGASSGFSASLDIGGDFTWSSGTIKRTNTETSSSPTTTIDFVKATGVQTYTQSGGTYTPGSVGITWSHSGAGSVNNIYSGGTMTAYGYLGATRINNFTINTTGTITLFNNATVSGTFYMTKGTFALGGKTLSWGASSGLEYNGTTDQTTGIEWPTTFAKNVTITNNSAGGVILNENKTYNTGGTITVNGNLNFSTYNISGTGAFTLASGGAISTAYVTNSEGFGLSSDNTTGSIRVSGARTLSTGGNYVLNGSGTAQNTGTNMPTTVNSLTVSNPAGITLSQATAVNGTLTLTNGALAGTLTYGANGILKYNGTGYTTTSDVEFPASSGPKDLNITVANASGISLHGNRSLAGAMTIASGQKFIIPASKQFTVNGALTNNGGTSGLVVNSGGSLIQNSAVSATVERSVSAWSVPTPAQGWHFLSSPVTAQSISSAFINGDPANYDFYTWWEPTNQWVNYKNTDVSPTWNEANGSANFLPGTGYLVGYAATDTKQFTGTLNTGNVTKSNLTNSAGTNHGWHLLGNPFTSALTWGTSDWSLNNVTATAKIWDATAASYTDVATDGKIPALNGFMVQVTSGTNSLTIPTTARAHDATSWYKSGDRPSITLVANDISGQTAQPSIVRFDNLATNEFDPEFDSHFLAGYAPMFYSVAGEEQLSTNALPETGGTVQIPFNFIKNEGTSFTIEATTISNISGPVILNDLLTHAKQDLTVNPVYSFTSATEDNPSRFLLTFSHVGVGEVQAGNAIRVFAVNNSIVVLDNSGKNIGNVYVYNTMGQMIAKSGLDGNSMCKLNLNAPTGYYLVKVVTGEQAVSAKVFINKQ